MFLVTIPSSLTASISDFRKKVVYINITAIEGNFIFGYSVHITTLFGFNIRVQTQREAHYVISSPHPFGFLMPQTPTPTSIPVSDAEVKSGYLSQRNLEIAVRALYMDGLVVLENLVSDHALDTLEKLMIKDAYDLQGRKDSPYNYNKGNIQQDPLLTPEYFFDDVYLSKPKASPLYLDFSISWN